MKILRYAPYGSSDRFRFRVCTRICPPALPSVLQDGRYHLTFHDSSGKVRKVIHEKIEQFIWMYLGDVVCAQQIVLLIDYVICVPMLTPFYLFLPLLILFDVVGLLSSPWPGWLVKFLVVPVSYFRESTLSRLALGGEHYGCGQFVSSTHPRV